MRAEEARLLVECRVGLRHDRVETVPGVNDLGPLDDVEDDAELLDELAGIEEDMLDEQLADLGPVPVGGVSVAAPAAAAPAAASTDDAEMQALQAMMMPA